MAMPNIIVGLAIAAMLLELAIAATYTVGAPNGGWDTSTDLQTWATSKTFLVGDNLIFQYAPSHDVLEVSQADYSACQSSNPVQIQTSGTTIIPLTSPGKRYFICGTVGHCNLGMKVEIDTLATSTPPPASPLTSPPTALANPIPPASPLVPPPTLPVIPPAPSTLSPETYAPSPASTPTLSPPSKFESTSRGPSPTPPPTFSLSPSGSLLPPPSPLSSSANKDSFRASIIFGFVLIAGMLLAL